MRKSLYFLPIFLALIACAATKPRREYAIAQSALLTAQRFSADKMSPVAYLKAKKLYKQGVSQYKQKNYERAKKLFESAILMAEKSELSARVQKLRESE